MRRCKASLGKVQSVLADGATWKSPLHRETQQILGEAVTVQIAKRSELHPFFVTLNTHSAASLYEALLPDKAKALWDRLEHIHTPKHGSWLNMAGINAMVRQCLDRRIDSIQTVRSEVAAWQSHRDNLQAKVNWQFSTTDARVKLNHIYPTTFS